MASCESKSEAVMQEVRSSGVGEGDCHYCGQIALSAGCFEGVEVCAGSGGEDCGCGYVYGGIEVRREADGCGGGKAFVCMVGHCSAPFWLLLERAVLVVYMYHVRRTLSVELLLWEFVEGGLFYVFFLLSTDSRCREHPREPHASYGLVREVAER